MEVLHPIWLLLFIPLVISLRVWQLPSRLVLALRVAVLSLILLAMCGIAVKLRMQAGTVVVVADKSRSMPSNSESRHKEAIDLIQASKASDSNLAVVSFGRTAAIEQSPQSGKFAGFVSEIHDDASDLNGAIETALALIPQDSGGVYARGFESGEYDGTAVLSSVNGLALCFLCGLQHTAYAYYFRLQMVAIWYS